MVDLSRLMQDAAILDVIDKSADEASSLSAQNSYQAMRIEDLERALAERNAQVAERDAEIVRIKAHAEAMAGVTEWYWNGKENERAMADALREQSDRVTAYRAAYPKE